MGVELSIARALHRIPVRHGSTSGWYPARWSEQVRVHAGVTTADDPPQSPLNEENEVEGVSDFSNYFDRHEDVSTVQAVGGLGFALGLCFVLWKASTSRARNCTPVSTKREFPFLDRDLPNSPRVPPRA